jgi:bacteriocin-like protein
MRKTPQTKTPPSLEDFLKEVKNGLLNENEMKQIVGGEDAAKPKTSHSRPLTGMY